MTVSHGVEGQLISEARICIYSDIKALIELYGDLIAIHFIIIIKFLAERRWRPCSSTALCPASL